MFKLASSLLILSLVFTEALAENQVPPKVVTFSQIWQEISLSSNAIKAADFDRKAAEEAQNRSAKHWLPKVYLDAKAYQTNDPGASFFGLLQQRSLVTSDFNPQVINEPGTNTFYRGALGVDLPLYEGGIKSNQQDLQTHLLEAKGKQLSHIRNRQYSAAASLYGSIAVLTNQEQMIAKLSKKIRKLIKSYKVGSKSNPVGYSGLLGLKSLANRAEGTLQQYRAQTRAQYAALKEMGFSSSNSWSPQFTNLESYLKVFLRTSSQKDSYFVESLKANAQVAEKASAMENSRYLPRVGVFAEGYMFNGDRETKDGYTAGLYLKWNLFSPDSSGRHSEARYKALSAQAFTRAHRQKMLAERKALEQSILSLRENLLLIRQSQKLLKEQVRMAHTLFRNGSMNALQLTQVLNQRVDLISQQTDVSLMLLKYSSQNILNAKFDIPAEIEGK